MRNLKVRGIRQFSVSQFVFAAAAIALFAPFVARGQQARELRDPATGAIWRLLPGDSRQGGPARWVLVDSGTAFRTTAAGRTLLIHSGDKIVVEEHSAIADARLTAIAITSAAKGEQFRARITVGGGVFTVRAVSAALAELTTEASQ